jgi:osmotically-inducible protein OsmY
MVGLKLGLCLAMLMLPLALGGCAGALLVGGLAGVAGGGYAAAQERGIGGAVSDLQIETNVESAFAAIDPGLKDGITTTVYQGRVEPPRVSRRLFGLSHAAIAGGSSIA